jgi:predicted nucleic acid-binding protein
MNVLVDTPVWSVFLRRQTRQFHPEQAKIRAELVELIREGLVQIIGPIRQELLSGIREEAQYRSLRDRLRAFDDVPLLTADFEEAARASNDCRAKGISGSPIDFLICAAANRRSWRVFTTDRDFSHYARHIPLRLHQPRP